MSLENFLVFFLFLLILQPNFLIKRFLIKKNTCIKKISCQKHLKIQIYTEGRVPQEFFCTCWKACFKLVRMVESAEGLELPKILKFRHQRKNTFLYFLLKWIRMTLKLLSCSSSDNCRLYFPCICTVKYAAVHVSVILAR